MLSSVCLKYSLLVSMFSDKPKSATLITKQESTLKITVLLLLHNYEEEIPDVYNHVSHYGAAPCTTGCIDKIMSAIIGIQYTAWV